MNNGSMNNEGCQGEFELGCIVRMTICNQAQALVGLKSSHALQAWGMFCAGYATAMHCTSGTDKHMQKLCAHVVL